MPPDRTWKIEVSVRDDGYTEAVLFIDGVPVDGSGDSTGTLTVQDLMRRMVSRVAVNAEDHRRRFDRAAR